MDNSNKKPMKNIFTPLLFIFLCAPINWASASSRNGFTDLNVQFYGEVRQVSGSQALRLQAGTLGMTFVNQRDVNNRVTVTTELGRVGAGSAKEFSYVIKVPLAYSPSENRKDEFLAIDANSTDFRIENITVDGLPATLPDGSREFYGLSFASRSRDYQLDLIVEGKSEDADKDGLPDWWEEIHGLDVSLADANQDLDNDGWDNLAEFRFGGDPNLSNKEPQLATAEVLVPELGVAGIYLHVLDSDSRAEEVFFEFSGGDHEGCQLLIDGKILESSETRELSLLGLQSGRLSVAHVDKNVRKYPISFRWNDGGKVFTGDVIVRAVAPSADDGNDASIWLDAKNLGQTGGLISDWIDRSGNGRNASQPTSEYQPVITGDSVDFSKSEKSHLFFSDQVFSSGDHTVFAAYKAPHSFENPQTIFSTNRGYFNVAPTSQPISYAGAATYQAGDLAVRGYRDHSGSQAVSIFRREGLLLQGIYDLSYDGENVLSNKIDPVLPTIGARRSALASNSKPLGEVFNGSLNELMVFPSALPEQKLRDVHDYLKSKWEGFVIWDLSTELMDINLKAGGGSSPRIIRGGHGDDVLNGGSGDDIISGGPGSDVLKGDSGVDRFVFGGVDIGTDTIIDFDTTIDVLDLSAFFWGQTGDARDYLSIRLDADFTTEVPTLDSVLLVQRPDGDVQKIVLKNTVIGEDEIIQLIVEGRINMGSLNIPAEIQVARPLGEQDRRADEPFRVVLTRSGEGVGGAVDIPIGFFEESLGNRFVVDEASSNEQRRSVVHFARGETSKILTVSPVPDLETRGPSSLKVAVLPHHKYRVVGSSVDRTINDKFNVWLEVIEPNAVSDIRQAARLRVHRDGDLSEKFTISLKFDGTAKQGEHTEPLTDSISLETGQSFADILVNARSAGLSNGAKVLVLKLDPSEGYQLGNPSEALVYIGATAAEANNAGFDRWLAASTNGGMVTLADLSGQPRKVVNRYLQAYAYGQVSSELFTAPRISFRIVDGKPELLANSVLQFSDLDWGVEAGSNLDDMRDQSASFTVTEDVSGTKFVGNALSGGLGRAFYRLSMNLKAGIYTNGNINALSDTRDFGISGSTNWQADHVSGDLVGSGGELGKISRIVAELKSDGDLNFEMEVRNGDGLLAFFIDGIKEVETSGEIVKVQRRLNDGKLHLLMWQFTKGTGEAVIRNLEK